MNALHRQAGEALHSRRAEFAVEIVAREFVRHPELEQRKRCCGASGARRTS